MSKDNNKKPVIIEVTNLRDGFLVVATRILNPKQTVKVPFSNFRQLEDAQIAEQNKAIEIHTEITPEIIEQLGGTVEEEEVGEEPSEKTPDEPKEVKPKKTDGEGVVSADKANSNSEQPKPAEQEAEKGDVKPAIDQEPLTKEYTASDIDKMTIKEMKDLIEEKDLEIENVNELKAAELKEAVKEALNLI